MRGFDKNKFDEDKEAILGWVTDTSYLISKIKNRFDENGKISRGWLLKNLEMEWITKWDWHSKN